MHLQVRVYVFLDVFVIESHNRAVESSTIDRTTLVPHCTRGIGGAKRVSLADADEIYISTTVFCVLDRASFLGSLLAAYVSKGVLLSHALSVIYDTANCPCVVVGVFADKIDFPYVMRFLSSPSQHEG